MLSIIITHFAGKIIDKAVADNSIGFLKKLFFPKKTYGTELVKEINKTIDQFEKIHPKTSNRPTLFYESQITFEILTNYFLFKEDNPKLIETTFADNPSIKQPSADEVNEFYSLFLENIDQNKKLKKLFIEENYKDEIFQQTQAIRLMLRNEDKILQGMDDLKKLLSTGIENRFSSGLALSSTYEPQGLIVYSRIEKMSVRAITVSTIRDLLAKYTWVSLIGSVSMGKTQLAILLSDEYESPLWIELKDSAPNQVCNIIIQELKYNFASDELDISIEDLIGRIPSGGIVILDDLPKMDLSKSNVTYFITLLKLFKKRSIKVLSTSNFKQQSSIKERWTDLKEYIVPYLSGEEVKEVLLAHNAPNSVRELLSDTVIKLSSGHPIVVTLIAIFLSENDWQIDVETLTALFAGNYGDEFDSELNEKLINTVSDPLSRELLYRLKLVFGVIKDTEVGLVSEPKPSIHLPLEKLIRLEGSWLQKVKNGYELSPLVKRLKGNLPVNLTKAINLKLARHIVSSNKLTQVTAYKAITYFVLADQVNQAGRILVTVLNSSQDNTSLYFDWGFDKFWSDKVLPHKMDVYLKVAIRFLQINTFRKQGKSIDFLIIDLEDLMDQAASQNVNVAPAAFQLTMHYADKDLIKANKFFVLALTQIRQVDSNFTPNDFVGKDLDFEMLIWNNLMSIKGLNDLKIWLSTFEQLDKQKLRSTLDSDLQYATSMILTSRLFDEEVEKNEPDWEGLLSIYDEMISSLKGEGNIYLVPFAYKYKIRINLRILKQTKIAEEIFQAGLIALSSFLEGEFIINDEYGRELLKENRDDEAYEKLLRAASINLPELFTDQIYTYLSLNEILAKSNPIKALGYLKMAYEKQNGNKYIDDVLSSKILGEYGIALWANNKKIQAFYIISDGLEKVLKSYKAESEYQAVIIRFGHNINFFYHEYVGLPRPQTDGEDYTAPFAGMFFKSNDLLLSSGFYFENRKFMQALLMVHVFEALNDLDYAIKWMQLVSRFDEDDPNNPFRAILMNSNAYNILDGNYEQAIERGQHLMTTSIGNEKDYSGLNPFLKKVLSSKDRPYIDIIGNLDIYLFEYILNFIVVHGLHQHIKSTSGEHLQKLLIALKGLSQYFSDEVPVQVIITAIQLVDEGKDVDEIIDLVPKVGDFSNPLKLLIYLITSIKADTKHAFQLHFALIGRLENMSHKVAGTANYRFIVIPFMIDFWTQRIRDDKISFEEYNFLIEKGVSDVENADPLKKMRKLFSVLAYHLNHDTNDEEQKWLESELNVR